MKVKLPAWMKSLWEASLRLVNNILDALFALRGIDLPG